LRIRCNAIGGLRLGFHVASKRDANQNEEGRRPRGHVRQRGPETFAIIIDRGRDLHGKRQQSWITFHGTAEEAEKEKNRLLKAYDEGTYTPSSGMRVKKYLATWLETDARMGITDKTYERYREIAEKHLVPAFGHLRLSELNPIHIKTYIQEALKGGRLDGKGGLSNQTVQHHVQVLHRALQDAVVSRLIPYNPAQGVKRPKAETGKIHVYTPDEMQMILSRAKERRIYMPTLLVYSTGLRRGEVLGLQWDNVDLDRGTLSVLYTLGQAGGSLKLKSPKTKAGARSRSPRRL
jgi:integrase